MSENTKIWDLLGRTDPSHTKQFKRAGGFSGTAIKPMWAYRRMTEEFGPAGKGWGVEKPSFDVVTAGDEILVYCTVEAWWKETDEGDRHHVFGVGGDRVLTKRSNGNLFQDDEAFKKAFTDALTNALKLIGVGADVHMGLFDDNKYVNDMKAEFAEPAQKPTSAAEMKRGLAQIDADLADCNSSVAYTKLINTWLTTMNNQNWSKDYRDEAKAKFERRREEIRNLSQSEAA
jgi:hypothetical protein